MQQIKRYALFKQSKLMRLGAILLFSILMSSASFAEEGIDSLYISDFNLLQGELEAIKVYSMTRLSLENPGVVDIVKADAQEILIIAKAPGKTALFVWDEKGKRIINIQVLEQDLSGIKGRIDKLIDSTGLKGVKTAINEKEGKVVISGAIQKKEKETFNALLQQFSSKTYLNLVKEADIRDLIQIDMLIVSLNSTYAEQLGVQWNTGDATGVRSIYSESKPNDVGGSIRDMIRVGEFSRAVSFSARLDAVIDESKGRVISKPKLVVKNKESAKINVGGEYPIQTTTVSGDTTTQNVTFKEYGVTLNVQPEIIDNRIELKLTSELRDLGAVVDGVDTPSFTTTTAETKVYIEDQQTIVIAGLIKKANAIAVSRLPILSKIPILGYLFRHKAITPRDDTEIIMTLKPTILSDYDDRQYHKDDPFVTDIPKDKAYSAKGAVAEVALSGIPSSMIEYVKNIQQKIAAKAQYPPEAEEYGWEGTVKIGVLINSDGTLAYTLVNESSGFDVFDNDAIDTVKGLAPFDNFPQGVDLQDLNVVIPIAYNKAK
ncbi:MAG: TonB family protein [Candidatus Omnitrophica bacterium]|nr:TonB family protein [Candidatus Omnitrophota bacterium]